MTTDEIHSQMQLEELFRRWPATLTVFMERSLLCVGCPIVPWHSISDSCREYGLDETRFLAELRAAAEVPFCREY